MNIKKIREKFWILLFKKFFFRKLIFYNLKRYKVKFTNLDNLNLNSKSIVVDIGANNGVVSQYLFDKYKCYIDIYEPNEYLYKILKLVFKKNNKITLNKKAVSNSNGKTKMFFHKLNLDKESVSLSESSSLEEKKTNIQIENFSYVDLISIDDVLKKHEKIDLLKIDIEGHEYKIMESIIKNIGKVGLVLCEMHGSSHRPEFKNDFKYWDKILSEKKLKYTKIRYW